MFGFRLLLFRWPHSLSRNQMICKRIGCVDLVKWPFNVLLTLYLKESDFFSFRHNLKWPIFNSVGQIMCGAVLQWLHTDQDVHQAEPHARCSSASEQVSPSEAQWADSLHCWRIVWHSCCSLTRFTRISDSWVIGLLHTLDHEAKNGPAGTISVDTLEHSLMIPASVLANKTRFSTYLYN